MNPPDYQSFRCGLTFQTVAAQLKAESDAAYAQGRYLFWTRRTVLGRLREYKQTLYRHTFGIDASDNGTPGA